MLQNHATAQFSNIDKVMFQQDGGPATWAMEIRAYINPYPTYVENRVSS